MSRDCSWKGPPAPHQETSVSTTRPLHVPPSWKVTVSPWPWASPRGVEKGGLRGAGGAVLTLKSIRSGEGTQADLGGRPPPMARLRASTQAGATGAGEHRRGEPLLVPRG